MQWVRPTRHLVVSMLCLRSLVFSYHFRLFSFSFLLWSPYALYIRSIEYNPNDKKCEAHTDGMMDRKENSDTMCCEKREISINRVPDSPDSDDNCVFCTDEPTSWMERNDFNCKNWSWGIPRRCNDTPDNSEYPYWERHHFCELSCAVARGGRNYPGRPPCCQLQ